MNQAVLLIATLLLPAPPPAPSPIQLGGVSTDDRKAFVWQLSGVDPADLKALASATRDPKLWPRFFTVHARPQGVTPEAAAGNPPLSGVARVAGSTLEFQTRFPPEEGMTYDFVLDLTALPGRPAGSGRRIEVRFDIARKPPLAPTTTVARVWPSSRLLPENLLKFYIEFTAPMSRGEAYEHLKLLDATGKPIDLPFLELGEELWDRERGVRFTVLFDPGRIKTGLKPREEAGPVLEEGKTYTLVVDKGWRDASGRPLAQEFRRTFRVGPADATPPDPKTWELDRPGAGGRAPLVVRSPEPLDRWIFQRALGVLAPDGRPVPGITTLSDDETTATFTPDVRWQPGRHALVVDRTLEDLAGNSVGRPFEVDVFQKVEAHTTAGTVSVPFLVEGGDRRE